MNEVVQPEARSDERARSQALSLLPRSPEALQTFLGVRRRDRPQRKHGEASTEVGLGLQDTRRRRKIDARLTQRTRRRARPVPEEADGARVHESMARPLEGAGPAEDLRRIRDTHTEARLAGD